jgi:hypothetical protein
MLIRLLDMRDSHADDAQKGESLAVDKPTLSRVMSVRPKYESGRRNDNACFIGLDVGGESVDLIVDRRSAELLLCGLINYLKPFQSTGLRGTFKEDPETPNASSCSPFEILSAAVVR